MRTERPLASIVIDNYNYGRFLAEAIESALAQTYGRTEVIVVDDGSTDDSREVIGRFDGRVRAVLKPNGGQGSALNAGFAACTGDVVCFLDADDALLPGAIEAAVGAFDDPRVSKVHWPMHEVDADGARTGDLVPAYPMVEGDLREETIARRGPIGGVAVPTSGNAWARWFLERIMPMPEAPYRTCADAYLFTLAPLVGTIRMLPEPQGLYRVHGANHYARERTLLHDATQRLEWYVHRAALTRRFLADEGVRVDPPEPGEEPGDLVWLTRVHRALSRVVEAVPPGERVTLIDESELGAGRLDETRIALPYDDGGAPASGRAAVEHLRRRASEGVTYVAVAWPAYWWLDVYPELAEFLADEGELVCDDEAVRVYALVDAAA